MSRLMLTSIGSLIGLVTAMTAAFCIGLPATRQVWRELTHEPFIRIDARGVWCREREDLGIIPWSDIAGASAVKTGDGSGSVEFLCLKLHNEEKYRHLRDPMARVTSRVELADFPVAQLYDTTPPGEEIQDFINRMAGKPWPAAAASEMPQAPQPEIEIQTPDIEIQMWDSLVPQEQSERRLTFVLASRVARDELVLDLAARTYRFTRGSEVRHGSFDAIKSLRLSVMIRGGGKTQWPVWFVALGFGAPSRIPPIAQFRGEQEAYAYFLNLARQLRVAACDLTGGAERYTPWNEIGRPLAQRSASPAAAVDPAPPKHSRIALRSEAPALRLRLPHPSRWPVVGVAAFFSMAWAMIWSLLPPGFWNPPAPDRGPLLFLFIMILIPFFGLQLALLPMALRRLGHVEIRGSADEIRVCYRFFGIAFSGRAIPKNEIVDIAVKPMPLSPRRFDVQLRTPERVLNWETARLSPDDQRWLEATLWAAARDTSSITTPGS